MAWANVTITTLSTITAADLNQMRDNAEYLRDEMNGRVLACAAEYFSVLDYDALYQRLRFDLGGFTWYTDWLIASDWLPLPGHVTNLSTAGLEQTLLELIVSMDHGPTPTDYQTTELFRLPIFWTTDVRYVSFYGEMRIHTNSAQARSITCVGAFDATLASE